MFTSETDAPLEPFRWQATSLDAAEAAELAGQKGAETEQIEPLDVILQGGETLAVSWIPGETAYTMEVFRRFECCA